ncbi:MAG TPA: Xaa-Pro aminopeptidase [Vicinamibacterales bacterium]|jgi:Xaa-Pro aminopeptidase|nr:Xaa-Pro aminopeptidase [Vicinamibacterales bacterium]
MAASAPWKRALVASLAAAALWVAAPRPIRADLPPFGGTDAYLADLAAHRAKTMARLGPESVLVVWSAPARVYSADIDYKYRQNSDLLYLTGLDQEETILVLAPGAAGQKVTVFTRAADPFRELWYGHILTPAEVTSTSGITAVYPEHGHEAFDAFMARLLGDDDHGATGASRTPAGEFAAAKTAGRARLCTADALDVDAQDPAEPPPDRSHVAWVHQMAARYHGVTACSARDVLDAERAIKTPYEQLVLRHSVEISAEAQVEGMKAARPGRWEYEVQAAIEYWSRAHGALEQGYPSIVASGPNATTLHYLESTRQMRDGDLLLVDAASSFEHLTGDITRTYPVNGRFTRDERALYELVLRAQDAGIAAARPGVTQTAVNDAARAVFADGLRPLGLITPLADAASQVSLWFPHAPTHGIGLDVHDPLDRLDVGTTFVIEPGLYIRPAALDGLPKTPDGAALRAALAPAVAKYRDMGVRIEDSFLMTADGPVMLSAKAPRRIPDIERVVGTRR